MGALRRFIALTLPTAIASAVWVWFFSAILQKVVVPPESLVYEPKEANEPLLPFYTLPEGEKEPIFLSPVDPSTLLPASVPPNTDYITTDQHTSISIQSAHSNGIIHIGAWLYVVDADGYLLFLKRGPTLVTCPNAWSLVGEHQCAEDLKSEDPVSAMTRRAVLEELGNDAELNIHNITKLSEHPLYFRREYGEKKGNRFDRQLTYLMLVYLKRPRMDIKFEFDDEVANARWVKIEDARKWVDEHDLCHSFMHALFEIGISMFFRVK